MSLINYNNGTRRKNRRTKRYYRKEEPFVCDKCSKVWQFASSDGYTNSEYLYSFPKIGCSHRICSKCRGDI